MNLHTVLDLYETADDHQANLNQYRKAQAATQLVIGPLARNITSALSSAATVPTIALSPMTAEGAAPGLATAVIDRLVDRR